MMKNKKIILLFLLIPALTLTGCQQAKASNESATVKATAYKKVYKYSDETHAPEVDYFIFYGKNGHKYKVDGEDVEYKYVTNSKSNKVKAIVTKGDYNAAVITLPVSQDKGME